MKSLSGLYAITDETLIPAEKFSRSVELALSGGARIIQYRDKSSDDKKRLQQARDIKRLCDRYQAVFIVNDDLALAKQVDADGVHIGLQDASIGEARHLLGENKIIGVSCYNRIELAREARSQGADYLAFGRFFSSVTKPQAAQADRKLFAQAADLQLPLCAIGGITQQNGGDLIQAGAHMLAVVAGVFAGQDIQQNSRNLSRLF